MKKIHFLLLLTTLTTSITVAQDILTKKNGEELNVKVLEVTTSEIKFKRNEIPNGPTYSIAKSEVLFVKYENGVKDIFSEKQSEVAEKPKTPIPEKKAVKEKEVEDIKVTFGIKGGLNQSNLNASSDFFTYKSYQAYHFGLFLEIRLNSGFSIQPELLYSMQGSKINVELRDSIDFDPLVYNNSSYTFTNKINYINAPIMAKFDVTKVFNIAVGPQLGYFINAKNENREIKSDFNQFDLGLNMGVGFTFNKVIIDLRYNIGLSEVGSYNPYDGKNRVFQLSLGYKFK
jgi:hypothetical protein